jgi:energy-coupling factor transport system permease protein
MSLVIPLLAFAIRRAGRTAIAMEARGLSPDAPRTIMNAPAFHGRDGVFVVVALGMLGLCGVAMVRGF